MDKSKLDIGFSIIESQQSNCGETRKINKIKLHEISLCSKEHKKIKKDIRKKQ